MSSPVTPQLSRRPRRFKKSPVRVRKKSEKAVDAHVIEWQKIFFDGGSRYSRWAWSKHDATALSQSDQISTPLLLTSLSHGYYGKNGKFIEPVRKLARTFQSRPWVIDTCAGMSQGNYTPVQRTIVEYYRYWVKPCMWYRWISVHWSCLLASTCHREIECKIVDK